jgi:hypothetical protein
MAEPLDGFAEQPANEHRRCAPHASPMTMHSISTPMLVIGRLRRRHSSFDTK